LALEKENPRETEARLLALEALLPGDPGRAIDSLRSLERELAKDPEVARRIALALLEAERPEEALLAFTRAAELAPKDPRPLLGRAEARLLLADLPGATADLALAGDLALPGTASRARARAREVRVRALSQDARAAALAKTALAERPQDLGLRFASSCLAGAEADQGELEKIAQALGRRSLAASAWAALARLRAEKGMRESALAAAKKAVELAPTAESLAAEALALGAGVDAGAESPQTVRRARALAHAAFERDRGEGARIFRASRTAARLFQRHGRPRDRERASTLLDLAERAAPWAAAPLLERGRRLEATREGALSDVTDALLPGLKLASGDPEAEVALAAVLLEQNEARHAATAVEWTEHVLEKQLKHARALALHGRAQLALGRAARALADLDASLAIDRSRAETWALKARALTMLGKADLAADAQREATERGPRRDELASSEEDKGIDLAYSKERDFTSAVAHFRRAIDLDPGRGRSWFELGVALLGGGTLPEEGGPIELLARGNYLEFQDGLARSGFVKLLANGIDLEAYAKEYESRAARAGASRSDDLWTAAILRSMIVEAGDESRGAIAQARLALERAISQDPSNVSALAYRGLCRALEGQSDLARHDLERFDLYCPKYGPALFTLALGEARDGKTSEAKAHLERAFSLDKDLRLRLVHYPELRALK
ncbi:hypothetical protein HY251_12135, partial [bacterium]|nr:hypothetical protein [bacterium]